MRARFHTLPRKKIQQLSRRENAAGNSLQFCLTAPNSRGNSLAFCLDQIGDLAATQIIMLALLHYLDHMFTVSA
jgi:hypothetical protein